MATTKNFVIIAIGMLLVVAITVPIILVLPNEAKPYSFKELVEVRVEQGPIIGQLTTEAGIFWGIPFSQPPTKEYRWQKPRNPLPFNDKYWNATYKRPACPQICDQPVPEYSCPHATDEDCLYLNVWIPRKLVKETKSNEVLDEHHFIVDPDYVPGGQKQPLPVMIWFYGGNFRNGAGSCVLYDGRFMASKGDVIVVTTNYRVAHLGFLVQGSINEEESKGNFGLWDQVKTMEWVKANIAEFGGNPNKVTLFGQSAGAESIGVHLTSDISKNLFHQVIMESNPFGLPFRDLDDARLYGNEFAEKANCTPNDMKCLRSKTLDELEAAYNATLLYLTDPEFITVIFQPWSPVIDGDVVPKQPLQLFMERKEDQKPMMMGATVDEAMIYVAEAFPNPMNSTTYNALLLAIFKEDYFDVIRRYPACQPSGQCDNRYTLSDLATEYLFKCPQRQAINSTSAGNRWLYSFNETWSFDYAWEVPLCFDKVCHAAELAYVFGVETLTTIPYTEEERMLSDRMIAYWTNFAKYGHPNYPGNQKRDLSDWPKFEWNKVDGYQALELRAEGDVMAVNPYNNICDFWDKLDAYAAHF